MSRSRWWTGSPSRLGRPARWPRRSRAAARWARPCGWRSALWTRTRRPSASARRPTRGAAWTACCAPLGSTRRRWCARAPQHPGRPLQAGAVLLTLCGRGGRPPCSWASQRCQSQAALFYSAGWPPWRPPSRALRPRSRRASRRRARRRPPWTTCAWPRPRCAPWAAGGRGAHLLLPAASPARAHIEALTRQRGVRAQVRQPVRRVGGRPADAAVLRLQHRALLLAGVPQGGLARGAQGRVPAPASARLTGAAARRPPAAHAPCAAACRLMCSVELVAASFALVPTHVGVRQRAGVQRLVLRGAGARSAARAVCARPLPAGAMRTRVCQRANRMSSHCVSALAR